MNRKAHHISSHEYKGGVYGVFYNEFSGNWFVKLEDGNVESGKYMPFDLPVRVPGSYNNESQCVEAMKKFAGG